VRLFNVARLECWNLTYSMRRPFLKLAIPICLSIVAVPWRHAAHAPPATQEAAPPGPEEFKPYVEILPGTTVKFEMVPIRGGTFTMGSPATERGRQPDEGPQHKVRIRPFWMQKTEMTWEAFDRFSFNKNLASNSGAAQPRNGVDAVTRPTPPYSDPTFGYGRRGHPIISVSHHAAMEFCRWLSARTGKSYRLPTEAEWEYACRAGTQTAYSFGAVPVKLSEHAWFRLNSEDAPHAVGLKKPNPWGLYDMHGNVAEWCLDLYDKDYYKTFDPLVPAEAPVLIPGAQHYPHVVRGGSWVDDGLALRCAARSASKHSWNRQDPQRPQSIWWLTDATHVGFRVVRPLEEQENLRDLKSQVEPL
jgi:formylglycine-generating enzyme required for sulfatase activity